ncbi:IGHMBP2 family helicase [Methanotorris igneus]|uniref:DNA helicase n=1 Tax=Methanotorris igneus (strain DSM 5666 / JCM 11834 / Kol 5) TaxID=880724 RepID=F6BEZ6_METIK|nr:IGHMBP2 family helicase [Methanotorris igneus]AEF95732.1 DNA helicase [Methanotorris igneus Kol 5]
MNIKEHYVNKFMKLIEKERKYEMDFHREEIKRLGDKREEVGRAILHLKGRKLREELGSIIVRYGRKKPFKRLEISVGDVVLISKGNPLHSDLFGNVVEIGKNFIDIAFDEAPPKWAYKDVRIDLYVNDITFKRMKKALNKFRNINNKLVGIILGIDEPRMGKEVKVKFFDKNLNESQKNAVINALRAKDLYLIHGPPGTGKTRTITEVIIQECMRKNKVLATADSNIAADNILSNLSKYTKYINIVRIGHPTRISKELIEHSLFYKVEKHEKYKAIKKIKEEMSKLMDERDKYKKPIPKWRRGMSDEEIVIFSKLNKDVRGVPRDVLKSMAKWIKTNEKIKKLREKMKKIEEEIIKEIIRKADVVIATNSMAGCDFLEGFEFDVCVIDEGSQSMEPSALIPIVKSKKLIMAGDHKQLPPTVLSEDEELKKTLFERLIKTYPKFSSILKIQYRMNEKIMEFPNKAFYDNKLKAHDSVKSQTILDLIKGVEIDEEDKYIINEEPVVFIDVKGKEKRDKDSTSYYNEEEAKVVAKLVETFKKYNIPVSVITPYDAQVKLISNLCEDIEVSTVDGFQGKENEVIIISFVRTEKFGFLEDLRRLNVAITRAKRKLVIVGCKELLSQNETYKELVKSAKLIKLNEFKLNESEIVLKKAQN